MIDLFNKLLELNAFENNSYFKQYIELINNNKETKKQPNITECHHIIPKIYFKFTKSQIDNSLDNLVNLKYCDHVLAHCLLALSFKDPYLVSKSVDAIYAVINSFDQYSTLEEFVVDYENIKEVLKCNHFVTEEQKEVLREISSNSHWYNNGERESFTRICPKGWVSGRLKKSKEQLDKISKAKSEKNSKSHWYNNGEICVFSQECPDGFVPGRIITEKLRASQKLNSLKSAEKTRKPKKPHSEWYWYNNGKIECRAKQCPEGFISGRLQATKTKIKNTKNLIK